MQPKRTPLICLRIVIAYVGSQRELAKEIGVDPSTVSAWVKKGYASAEYVKRLSALTGGDVSVDDLLPE